MSHSHKVTVAPVIQSGGVTNYSWRIVGILLKVALLFPIACLFWRYFGSGLVKPKFHGAAISAISGFLALQEFLFFNARSKLGEAIKSPAIRVADLDSLLTRIVSIKRYADSLWLIALPLKVLGVVLGLALFWMNLPEELGVIRGIQITGDSLLATLGWWFVFCGADVTVRTFRLFKHIDASVATLEVEARKLAASKEAAAAFVAGLKPESTPSCIPTAAITPEPDSYSRRQLNRRPLGDETEGSE